ncbi:glycoside hydrolase superfamily [Powellomyces hirtus]|nr:glycoside hydrolase superfamily [Powellomyces hirtus]
MRFSTLRKVLITAAIAATCVLVGVSAAPSAAPGKAANGDYTWASGAQYTAGQVVDYQGNRYKVVVNHISQVDWYPGCCAVLWELVGALGGTGSTAGAPVSGGTVGGAVTTAPPGGSWGSKTFAPYIDVMLWPTVDVSTVNAATGIKHFTLAFIFAGGDGNPAWGGVTPMSQNFYLDIIGKLRSAGGDVIVSFGGANGQELAQATTDVAALQAKYQAVINQYQLTWIDLDIEGPGLPDKASVDRRNKALAALQKANPKLTISYTLPTLPTGLTADGVYLLQSAAKAGLNVNVVNIMAMDYGAGVAPNGATGMGGYAISAAAATYKQAQAAGLKSAKVGVTPMIGVNDVQGEVFRIEDAAQLIAWTKTVDYVAEISMWSVNRDTSKSGPLYASSQVKQNDYDYAKTLIAFETGSSTLVPPPPQPRKTTGSTSGPGGSAATPLGKTTWGSRTFAPYVDVLLWPTLDISAVAQTTGANFFTLAFIVADTAADPAWGGVTKVATGFYLDILTKLRALGGDAIISFGGATGTELAIPVTDVKKLTAKYQSVINKYKATWLDFDIEGHAILNSAANDRRNQAIAALQKANPKVKVSYTLAVTPNGLVAEGLALLASAKKHGARIDLLNIMAMDYGPGAAPNGATGMGGYAISAAKAAYAQVQAAGFPSTKIGITPMIGQNDVQGEIFRLADAAELVKWASSQSWVGELAMWSVNRDTAKKGPLYASSQISQNDYDFTKAFKPFNQGGVAAGKLPRSLEMPVVGGLKARDGAAEGEVADVEVVDLQEADAGEAEDAADGMDEDGDVALPAELDIPLPPWTNLDMPIPPARQPNNANRGRGVGAVGKPDPELIMPPTRRDASNTTPKIGKSLSWTTRTFAPYIDVTAWPTFDFLGAVKKAGIRHFSLGFIVADKDGDPSWGGYYKCSSDFLKTEINTLRKQHQGDVIVSFGGAAGKELGLAAKNVAQLVKLYQEVIDTFKVTYADFDIEGSTLGNKKVVDMRNKALAIIQQNNPGLVISYTLPTEINGITEEAEALLENAVTNKVTVDVVNIMVMDYDPADCPGKTCLTAMGKHAISAAKSLYATLQKIGLKDTKVGLTPMIGMNDISGEVFTLANAQELVNFARKTDWIAFFGFWSLNRDNSKKSKELDNSSGIVQGDWGFSQIMAVYAH